MNLIKMLFPAALTVCFALPVFAKNSLPVIVDDARNIAKIGDKVIDLSGIDRRISFKKTNKKNPGRSPNGFFVSTDTQFYTNDNHCILTADPNHYWDNEHPDSYYNGNNCDFLFKLSREVDPDQIGYKIFHGTDITAEPVLGEDLSFLIPYLGDIDSFINNYPHPATESYVNPIYIYNPTKHEGIAFPSLYPYHPELGYKEYLFKPGTYTYMVYAVVDGVTYESTVEYVLSYKNDYNNMFPAAELFDWENGGECTAIFPDHGVSPQCGPIKVGLMRKISELSLGIYQGGDFIANIVRPGTMESGLNTRVMSAGYTDIALSAAMPILDVMAIGKSSFFKDFGPYEYYFFDGTTTHYSGYDITKGEYTLKLKITDEDGVPFEKTYPVIYDYDNDYNNMWSTGIKDPAAKQAVLIEQIRGTLNEFKGIDGAQLKVINMQGKTVKTGNKVSLNDAAAGIYAVEAVLGNQKEVRKVVKQ